MLLGNALRLVGALIVLIIALVYVLAAAVGESRSWSGSNRMLYFWGFVAVYSGWIALDAVYDMM